MSTNRPFLSNFFAAFRAHSALQKAATNSPSGSASTSTPSSYTHNASSSSTSPNASSTPRAITTTAKSNGHAMGATTAAVQAAQFQPTRQHAASPYSRSPGSPGSPGFPMSSPTHKQRRGSDSSSDGFREVTDKWYIGGRTATGEERYYRLGMVKRQKSIDRLSLDRLSL